MFQKLLKIFIIVFLTILVFLFILHFLLRLNLIPLSFSMNGYDVIIDKDMLYRLKPHSRPDINQYGFRSRDFSIKKGTKKRVLFLGDSFVYGLDLKFDETVPEQLGRLLGDQYEVINMGVLGYGPDQSLIQLKKEGLKLKPDLVILGAFPGNDFTDIAKNQLIGFDSYGRLTWDTKNSFEHFFPNVDLGFFGHYLKLRLGYPDKKMEKMSRVWWVDMVDFPFIVSQDSQISRFKMMGMYEILREFRDELAKDKIPFMVVVFPSYDELEADPNKNNFKVYGLTKEKVAFLDQSFMSLAKQLNIDTLWLFPIFRATTVSTSRFATDKTYHLNPQGAKETAENIARHLKQINFLK